MDPSSPHLAEPAWIGVAVLVPLAFVVLYYLSARARRRDISRLIASELAANLLRSYAPARRAVKGVLIVASAAALGLALCRPQWGIAALKSRAVGDDVVFVLDCSQSMLVQDVRPNRLARARLAILDFLEESVGGRAGLVAFAGQAFVHCPLTADHEAFRQALASIDQYAIPVQGTHIGRALEQAQRAMDKKSARKIMILLTDGEDLETSGIRTAEQLSDEGVRIYCIGVGTPAGGIVITRNEQGVALPLTDEMGRTVVSRLDETTLRAIAAATGGTYTRLGMLSEGMARIQRVLENSREMPQNTTVRHSGIERYYVPAAIGLVLLVAESFVSTRRRVDDEPEEHA